MREKLPQETYEQQLARLTPPYARFIEAWSQRHTCMKDITAVPFDPNNPRHAINHYVSPSIASLGQVELEPYIALQEFHLSNSFEDPSKMDKFVASFDQPYPYFGGEGRSYAEVLAEDYLGRGLNVVATLGHPEDRLTDSPRFNAALALSCAKKYGLGYAASFGLVAGIPLKLEQYQGVDVDTIITLTADEYYTATDSDSVDQYMKIADVTPEERDEFYTFINLGFGRVLMRDARPKTSGNGKLIVMNTTAKRAEIVRNTIQEVVSTKLAQIKPNTARIADAFQAAWPVAVVGDEIRLGPFIPLLGQRPANGNFEGSFELQRAEDVIGVVTELIDDIYGKPGIASYDRQTPPGIIFEKYNLKDSLVEAVGAVALKTT